MFIGYYKVNIFLPESLSLKEKRRILLGIKEKVRRKFNVAVAEKPVDKWQIAELSFVCINYTRQCVDELISKIDEFLRLRNDIQIMECEKGIL